MTADFSITCNKRKGSDMKKEWIRTIAAVLCVTMVVASIAACGKSTAEPKDSLVASETYTPATAQAMEDDELTLLIKSVVGDDWDGDFSKLTKAQRNAIENALAKQGYAAEITDNGVSYFSHTPMADEQEIADAAKTALGDESWTGSFADLDDDQKIAVRDELRKRGYDADVGESGFEFKNEADRKEQTTKFSYDRLPTQIQIIGAVADVVGSTAARKWDGDMLSLTPEQRKAVLKNLNDYGFDLALNEQGEFYMVHNPVNKVSYKTAYTPETRNGTTRASTTVVPTTTDRPTENVTGTEPSETISAPAAERVSLSTFGGTGGDNFQHVAACKDGGYIVTAQFLSTDGDYDGTDKTWKRQKSAVVKYDKNGNYQWKATVGGKDIISDTGVLLFQSAELTDGSIVTVGYTGARNLGAKDVMDALLICYDANGSRKWLKCLDGSLEDAFTSVCATPDGGFVVGGRTHSSDGDYDGLTEGSKKAILMKYKADGTREWMKSFNSGSNVAYFTSLAVTDNGYIYGACYAVIALGSQMQLDMLQFAGYGGADSIVFKFDPNGELLTHRTIAGSGNDQINALALAKDGGVIVGGSCTENVRDDSVFAGKHNYGKTDAFLIRLDAGLLVEWVKTFGGVGNDAIYGVAQIKGGYAAVGRSESADNAFSFLGSGGLDAFVLTVSENGSEVEKNALNGTKNDMALGMVCADGRQIAVVGATQSTTNLFSGLTPASKGANVAFFALYRVK